MRIVPILIGVLLAGSVAFGDAVPTLADLQKLCDDKQWTELLKASTRVLALRGDADRAKERPDVWILKAEGQMQTSIFSAARDSLESAAKEPAIDPEKRDQCLALALVVRKGTPRGYTPAATKQDPRPETIDILDPAKRPDAIKKLYEAELADLQTSLAKAKVSGMPGMTRFARDARELMPVARAAEGSTARIDDLLNECTASLNKTVTEWSDKQKQDIDRITKAADEMIRVEDEKGKITLRRRGLTGTDRRVLDECMKACAKLARDYEQLTESLGEGFKGDLSGLPPKIQGVHDAAKSASLDRAR